MTEDHTARASDEPTAATKQRKKRKWDQPAEDLVSAAAAAAAAGLPVMSIGALSGVPLPSASVYPSAAMPHIVPAPYALSPQLAPSVLQSAAAAVQKLSQAKMPDELIAREIVINDADPSVRYKLTKRQTQDEIQRCTSTVIITRGKYHPPNGQPDGEKPLYLHISAGSQLKETSERIKAVDHASSMIEEILKQGQIPEATSVPCPPIESSRQAVHPFSASIFLGFDADPSLNIAARIRGPNDQYVNHIMNETGVTVVLRGKDSGNQNCHVEAPQQSLHLYLSSVHLKSLEAAKVLAENLLDTIAAEFGASRISSSKVYGAVPPPQQLLAGFHTSGTISDVHSTLGPNVSKGASHCFVSSGVAAPIVAPPVPLQSGNPAYLSVPPPSNLMCPSQPANGGTCYSGYGGIYPQATPLQQVALTLKHASSTTTQVVPSTSTPTSMVTKVNSDAHLLADKSSQKRKFKELPVSMAPTTELQNSQQGSKFVKTGLNDLGKMSDSSIAHPVKVQGRSNGMLPQDPQHMPSHFPISSNMLPPPPRSMPVPPPPPKFPSNEISPKSMPPLPPPPKFPSNEIPSKSMPPPPPKFPSNEIPPKSMPPPPPKFPSNEMARNEKMCSDFTEAMAPSRSLNPSSISPPKFLSTLLPSEEPREEKPIGSSVSDTLLKLMDYGDDDDDDIDSVSRGNPTLGSRQKPFWAV